MSPGCECADLMHISVSTNLGWLGLKSTHDSVTLKYGDDFCGWRVGVRWWSVMAADALNNPYAPVLGLMVKCHIDNQTTPGEHSSNLN